jgi:uncharacterized protein YnzC (UPF0291/DUF896 family)
LYEHVAPDVAIRIRVKLTGCNGRELAAFDPNVIWFDEGHISHENTITQEWNIQVAELRASYLEVAREAVKHVFHVFDWLDVADSAILEWQQKLLKRQS